MTLKEGKEMNMILLENWKAEEKTMTVKKYKPAVYVYKNEECT
jgi:hypothetical protein